MTAEQIEIRIKKDVLVYKDATAKDLALIRAISREIARLPIICDYAEAEA